MTENIETIKNNPYTQKKLGNIKNSNQAYRTQSQIGQKALAEKTF